MNAEESKTEVFDVFLCHNSEDKPVVREIAKRLVKEGIKPWLDEEQIRPGTSFQKSIGRQIESIKSAAVFVGENGFGPWQDQETQALLSQFVKRECPVIPAILPSAKTAPELPWTLANLNWVDFRVLEPDPLKQLLWGITGVKPSENLHSVSDSPLHPEAGNVQALVPPKERVTIEIRLPGKSIEEFSAEERDSILAGLYSLLKVGEIKVTQSLAGSIRLRLELTPEDADKIYGASQTGQLAALGISEARLYPAIAAPPDKEERSQLVILLDRVNETWVEGLLRSSLYNEVLISLGKRPMEEAVEPPWKTVVEFSSQRSEVLLKDRNISTIFDATGLLLILGEPGSGKTTTLLELASNLIVRSKADPKERVPVVLNLSSWKKKQSLADWIALELSQKYLVPVKLGCSWLQNDYLLPLLDGLDEVPSALQPDCVRAINKFVEDFQPAGLVVCSRLKDYQWLPQRLELNGAVCIELLTHEEVSKFLDSGGPEAASLREAVKTDPVLKELTETPLMLNVMSLVFQGTSGNELARQKGDSPEERRKQIFRLYVEKMFQRKETASLVFPKEKTIGWLSWLAGKMREHSQSVFLVEGLLPSWLGTRAQPKRIAYEAIGLLVCGLIFGPVCGFQFGLIGWLISPVFAWSSLTMTPELLLMRRDEPMIEPGLADVVGMFKILTRGTASPNESIKYRLQIYSVKFLVFWVTFGLIFWLLGALGPKPGLREGFFGGLTIALTTWVAGGGAIVSMHYVLRITLWLTGCTSFNFIKFLDECAKLILLKKVGGGYIFIHRMLLEYFAELAPQSKRLEAGANASK